MFQLPILPIPGRFLPSSDIRRIPMCSDPHMFATSPQAILGYFVVRTYVLTLLRAAAR